MAGISYWSADIFGGKQWKYEKAVRWFIRMVEEWSTKEDMINSLTGIKQRCPFLGGFVSHIMDRLLELYKQKSEEQLEKEQFTQRKNAEDVIQIENTINNLSASIS